MMWSLCLSALEDNRSPLTKSPLTKQESKKEMWSLRKIRSSKLVRSRRSLFLYSTCSSPNLRRMSRVKRLLIGFCLWTPSLSTLMFVWTSWTTLCKKILRLRLLSHLMTSVSLFLAISLGMSVSRAFVRLLNKCTNNGLPRCGWLTLLLNCLRRLTSRKEEQLSEGWVFKRIFI